MRPCAVKAHSRVYTAGRIATSIDGEWTSSHQQNGLMVELAGQPGQTLVKSNQGDVCGLAPCQQVAIAQCFGCGYGSPGRSSVPEALIDTRRLVAELDFWIVKPPVVNRPGFPQRQAIVAHDSDGAQQPQKADLPEAAEQDFGGFVFQRAEPLPCRGGMRMAAPTQREPDVDIN